MMEVKLRRLGPCSKAKILKVPEECNTKVWLAGRGSSCQIYTKSKFASRQHFSITYKEEKYYISDLKSANGTYLNDKKIMCEELLSFGSVISVGVPSTMQDSPECIVYMFESNSEECTDEILAQNNAILKENLISSPEPHSTMHMDVDPPTHEVSNNLSLSKSMSEMDTILEENSCSDIELIEPSSSKNEPRPAKIRKLNDFPAMKQETESVVENAKDAAFAEDEDIFAYEALTQVDEPQIKAEPDLLNYSLTEELIEISDSEDDWAPILKNEGNKSPEAEEDDDIVVLETINRSKDAILPEFEDCKILDELTETDKKWLGRLLKVKKETEFFEGDDETKAIERDDQQKKTTEDMIVDEDEGQRKVDDIAVPDDVSLAKHPIEELTSEPAVEELPRVEASRSIIKRSVGKKSVSFDLVPQIKYIEAFFRPKLTASEKGRMRFTRVIYNICNWNTHWLEECKRVAPEKDPPDICEERLRKIPKKFSSHSDYMVAFIPPTLLHLWNKVKSKWVNSGDSGFRQTVSCDSYEDFQAENLSVFKCTGLALNVNTHKQFIREGYLVLLRLHQIQNPALTTPATKKYSKKLGYLVFGLIESRLYERYDDQPLHRSLAERSASAVGDLHIVRLTILVKKRPGFHVDKQKLIQMTVVQQISNEIKMFKGICFLPDSPLCNAILKPTSTEVISPVEHNSENIIFKGPLDEFQREIIRNLSHTFSLTSSLLFSIHGAAGTGKGQVIIGLILQFLYGEKWKRKRPKILLCTQWSIPLDEMVIKLKNHRQAMVEPFKLVRVGPIREVKPEVRDMSLSFLASNYRNADKRNCFNRKKIDAEIEVLKEADVICTTCASAGISKMCAAFEKILARNRNQKVICIIDEAMSCREPDSIIPLLLGVTHLILVGDIYQLDPIFSGEKTHSLGFDNSLFMRIYKNFTYISKDLWPVYLLKTQYRMNSSLSKFTSQLVYNTVLQKPTVSPKWLENIKCHLLLVDQTSENLEKHEKENQQVRIISQLIITILKITKVDAKNPVSLAVITSDSKQTENLHHLLPKTEYPEVSIDQIQAFQGREFEVVVFAYDGKKIPISWLTTALTRARSSLIIFASEQSLNGNPLFSKAADYAKKYGFLKYVQNDMTPEDWKQILTRF